jgi:hypothetical protein
MAFLDKGRHIPLSLSAICMERSPKINEETKLLKTSNLGILVIRVYGKQD